MAARLATVDVIPTVDWPRAEQEQWDRECAARWAAQLVENPQFTPEDQLMVNSWVGVILTREDIQK
jgi:predicted alpha/beta hydrolase family esterase